ncbi:MAG: alpha/beta hydrolase [Victivallales bacterium]|jgi:acetyl esterase/lipase|nr:alpha/beta hydrolase [Victivallales bacterium]
MRVIPQIAYLPEAGERGVGDLYLPERVSPGTPIALLIHGGGWSSMDKSRMVGIAEFLCEQNFAVFNINYRLLNAGPWPLCGDDCKKAAEFVLAKHIPELDICNCERLLIVGGSAGGHLALMTGLRLPPRQVSGIISLSGVNDITVYPTDESQRKYFFGGEPTEEEIAAANPISLITPAAPPILCTHTIFDTVVSFKAAENFVAKCHEVGAKIEFYRYDRSGDGHCLWIQGSSPPKLLPELEQAIMQFIAKYAIATPTP